MIECGDSAGPVRTGCSGGFDSGDEFIEIVEFNGVGDSTGTGEADGVDEFSDGVSDNSDGELT